MPLFQAFVVLAFKGISSFLHNRRHKALHKTVKAMSIQTDMQRNKLKHLENTLVVYQVYNAEMLERLVKTVHALHSRQTLYDNLFTGRTSAAYEYYSQMHTEKAYSIMQLIQCYFSETIKDK